MFSEGTEDVNTSPGFRVSHSQNMQRDFLISADSFVQRAGIAALSKEGDEARCTTSAGS